MTFTAYGANHVRTYTHPFTAETTEYGQLETILSANDGYNVDSLSVVGPIDATDIKAIMNCARHSNLLCINLQNAEIENESIPAHSFRIYYETHDLIKIRRIILPESVKQIGKLAFGNMWTLEEINIPASLREIGKQAFTNNSALNSKLVFPEGMEQISAQAFEHCESLSESPVFPSSLKKVGAQAFTCTDIQTIEFQEGLEEIEMLCFAGCANLKHVTLPQSCNILGLGAFESCMELRDITLPDGLEIIPTMCFYGSELETLELNSGCRIIESSSFGNTPLTSLTLNEGLERIEMTAFEYNNLTEIKLPTTLKWLGKDCFTHHKSETKVQWEKVWCPCTVPPECWYDEDVNLCDSPFGSWTSLQDATLYVPVGTAELYRNAPGWFQFGNIVETSEFPGCSVDVVPAGTASETGTMYDLTGRRITEPRDGEIYVRDGKKYVK